MSRTPSGTEVVLLGVGGWDAWGPSSQQFMQLSRVPGSKKLYKKLSYAVNTWRLRSAREACALVGFTTRVPPSPLVCVGGCWSQTDRITCTVTEHAYDVLRVGRDAYILYRVNINRNYISCTNITQPIFPPLARCGTRPAPSQRGYNFQVSCLWHRPWP